MILALVFGLLLQFAVTEIEPLIALFGTVKLEWMEWGQLLALSLTPVIVHELLVAVHFGVEKKEVEVTQACQTKAAEETAH